MWYYHHRGGSSFAEQHQRILRRQIMGFPAIPINRKPPFEEAIAGQFLHAPVGEEEIARLDMQPGTDPKAGGIQSSARADAGRTRRVVIAETHVAVSGYQTVRIRGEYIQCSQVANGAVLVVVAVREPAIGRRIPRSRGGLLRVAGTYEDF